MECRRTEFGLFRTLVEKVTWERVLKGKGMLGRWIFFKEEVLKAQEQDVPMCCKTNQWGRRLAWLKRELLLGLRKKRRVYHLWKKGQATQEEYRGLIKSCRGEIEKAKAQLELRLATVVKDNKKCFYKYINSKKRAKENLHPFLDVGEILPPRMRKRLRYLMPSLPHSLIVRLFIPGVVSPQCWKIGKECRTNLDNTGGRS